MQRGFTLLELAVVVSVLAITAVMALIRIGNSIAVREMEDSAQQLAADIRWTQQAIVNTDPASLPVLIFVNAKPFGYKVTQGTRVIKKNTFPSSVELTGSPDPVAFKLSGLPVGGKDLTFILKSSVVNEMRKVTIALSTGRVRVEMDK